MLEWPELTAVKGSYSLKSINTSDSISGLFGTIFSIFVLKELFEVENFSSIMRIALISVFFVLLILMLWTIFASIWFRVIALEVDGYGFRYITRRGTQEYSWMDVKYAYYRRNTPYIVVQDANNRKKTFELPSHSPSKTIMDACQVRGKLRPDNTES